LGKLKENLANVGNIEKALEGMNTIHGENAQKLLLPNEEIIQCYGLLLDFACITNKRLYFVDASISGKKKVISIPFCQVAEVHCDYGHLRGEVTVISRNSNHELKMGNELGERFTKDLLAQVLN
jgi:hypothetical protein